MPRERTRGHGNLFVTPEILVSGRPDEAESYGAAPLGGGLIIGLHRFAIGTLAKQTTRFTLLLQLLCTEGHGAAPRDKRGPASAGHGAEAVRDAITATITSVPEQVRRSPTWDPGSEMAARTPVGRHGAADPISALREVRSHVARTSTPTGR